MGWKACSRAQRASPTRSERLPGPCNLRRAVTEVTDVHVRRRMHRLGALQFAPSFTEVTDVHVLIFCTQARRFPWEPSEHLRDQAGLDQAPHSFVGTAMVLFGAAGLVS